MLFRIGARIGSDAISRSRIGTMIAHRLIRICVGATWLASTFEDVVLGQTSSADWSSAASLRSRRASFVAFRIPLVRLPLSRLISFFEPLASSRAALAYTATSSRSSAASRS
jgi:hypothetical protein